MASITIIGGRGLMGQLFVRFWQQQHHHVAVLERDNWDQAKTLLAADLVVVSVPIQVTASVIEEAVQFLRPDTVLADFTSLQHMPLTAMLDHHSGPVLGLHPMFGPTIGSSHHQVIIASVGRGHAQCQWVLESLEALGFSLKLMNATAHDEAMGFIQGLEHFNTYAMGTFLQEKNVPLDALMDLASPIYQVKLQLLGRIFDQDPGLYADIIMADTARIKLIEEYVAWMQGLLLALKACDRDKFIAHFQAAAKWMGEFTHHAQLASDQLLNNLPKTAD